MDRFRIKMPAPERRWLPDRRSAMSVERPLKGKTMTDVVLGPDFVFRALCGPPQSWGWSSHADQGNP